MFLVRCATRLIFPVSPQAAHAVRAGIQQCFLSLFSSLHENSDAACALSCCRCGGAGDLVAATSPIASPAPPCETFLSLFSPPAVLIHGIRRRGRGCGGGGGGDDAHTHTHTQSLHQNDLNPDQFTGPARSDPVSCRRCAWSLSQGSDRQAGMHGDGSG